MQFIDSHAHINSDQFKQNWQQIISDAHQMGVSTIINNASDIANTEWGIEQSKNTPGLYTTAGIHPEFFLESDELITSKHFNNLRRLISSSSKVVAIGEIGLDYTLDLQVATKAKQHDLLLNHFVLAQELNLPVTLHVRDLPGQTECFADMITMLKQFTTSTQNNKNPITGVFHCWVGTPSQAQQALELGFYVCFSGILTYKSAGHILDAAATVPMDKILIETDAPFLTPEPARSQIKPQYNKPEYVIMTAEKLAAIKNISLAEIAEITSANTRRLFNIDR